MITRAGRDGAEILLVHRPRYDDWTLPKGKAEAGESDEDCALREVEEETGLLCELGPEVTVSEYEDAAGHRSLLEVVPTRCRRRPHANIGIALIRRRANPDGAARASRGPPQ